LVQFGFSCLMQDLELPESSRSDVRLTAENQDNLQEARAEYQPGMAGGHSSPELDTPELLQRKCNDLMKVL
jgi:hypothetical protein